MKLNVIDKDGVLCIRMDEISKEMSESELDSFSDFILGQTVMVDDDGESLIYKHDFDRWNRRWHNASI